VLFHVVENTYNPLTVTAEVASSSQSSQLEGIRRNRHGPSWRIVLRAWGLQMGSTPTQKLKLHEPLPSEQILSMRRVRKVRILHKQDEAALQILFFRGENWFTRGGARTRRLPLRYAHIKDTTMGPANRREFFRLLSQFAPASGMSVFHRRRE